VSNSKLEVLRLITASTSVLALVNNGDIFNIHGNDGSRNRCVEAFDQLQIAADQAVKALPSAVSPFLRYRVEVIAETTQGQILRGIVLHMAGDDEYLHINLLKTFATLNTHYAAIAMEMLNDFMRDPYDEYLIKLRDEIYQSMASLPMAA